MAAVPGCRIPGELMGNFLPAGGNRSTAESGDSRKQCQNESIYGNQGNFTHSWSKRIWILPGLQKVN